MYFKKASITSKKFLRSSTPLQRVSNKENNLKTAIKILVKISNFIFFTSKIHLISVSVPKSESEFSCDEK